MPTPSEAALCTLNGRLTLGWTLLLLCGCGSGATDAAPLPPLTAVTRVDVLSEVDSALVGDSVMATARSVNREGTALPLGVVTWSSSDSSVGAVTGTGVLRGRNVGTVTLSAITAGVVGTRTIRLVPRAVRVRIQAPDTASLTDLIDVTTTVETSGGIPLAQVAPRLTVRDSAVARVVPSGVGVGRLQLVAPGQTELLAIVGRDTTRRALVVRFAALRSIVVAIDARVVNVGDSVPFALSATDTLGRAVATTGSVVSVLPAGAVLLRSNHIIALGTGRVVISVTNGAVSARDTLTALGPSEFPLDLVDGDGQRPLPLRVLLSMERVTAKWRQVLRRPSTGSLVQLRIGECRNAIPVAQFITGARVLIKLDTLPRSIAGQGGPCVLRANGLPLLGTVSLNLLTWASLSDRKLDDLIQHEVGHVLGIGSIWGRGAFLALVPADSASPDPLFLGPYAIAAFAKLGGAERFTGLRVPLQRTVLGHWREDSFRGEIMAPALTSAPQPLSAVTVAALRDFGWDVEPEAYEEYRLPEVVLSLSASVRSGAPGAVSPRIVAVPGVSLDGDVLLPRMMLIPGRGRVMLDSLGRVPFR